MYATFTRFAKFFTLFLCLFVVKAQSQSNVLIVAASTYTSDVQAKLTATGLFGKVDVFDANSGTPTVATLSAYQSVLVFSDEGFYNSTSLGNNLASYANAGGGVVTATFTFYPNSAYYVGGNFATTYQVIIPANGFTAGSTQTLGTIFYPNNPTIKGITNFNGGTSSYRNTSTSLTLGSYIVANWNDGLPLVVVKNNVGPANVNRVDLNFYPPSSDIRSDFWLSSTQGASLMAKALQYVSSAPAPTISSFTPTTASTGTTVTVTGTNLTGATAVSFGGTAATSFSVVNSTTVTAVVGNGTNGNVSVTTSGGTTTLSGFTYCTNVTPSVNVAASPSGAICSGTNVTFTATPTNGGTALTYQWQKNGVAITTATTSTYSYAPANGDVITCTLTANNTCQTTNTATGSITETVNALPTATITAGGTTTFCSGSSVSLAASVGTSYLWSNGATTQSISATTAGAYSVKVTNTSGCSATSSATTVTVNALPTATITVGSATTFCSGGSVTLTASSGSSYAWSNGATTQSISATTAGNYTVTVTNSNGCSATSSATAVTVKSLSTSTTTAAICSSGSYTFNGTTYTTAGTYVAHLTNAVGCDSAATLVLSVKLLSTSTTTAAICNGGSYTFNGTTYTTAGTYVAHLTNAVGCDSAATLILTVKSLSTSTTAASICNGGSYTFNGTTYTTTGTYVAHLTNAVGCDSAATLRLTVKSLSTSTTTAAICSGSSYTFNGTAYSTAGTYVSHLTNAVGCDSAATLVLTVKSLSTSTTTASICAGGSYTFNGTTYTTAGTYVAHLTNAVGCDSAATLVLTVNALPTTSISGTSSFCAGTNTLLTDNATAGSGNIACYKWYLNGTAIAGAKASTYTATSAGNYTVSVFNTNGCSVTSSAFAVAVNPLPTPTISGPTYGCGTVSYTASGGVSYLWNNGSTPTAATNTFTTATGYGVSVTATNANGCTATATQTVPANTAPTISSVSTQNTLVATSVSPTVTVGDLETPNSLTVTACSNNATLVPKANITVTGTGATRTITVTPAQYQIGTATIIVKVTDCGGLSTTTSFNVNVTVPNYPTGTANFAIVKTVSLIDNCSDSIYFVNESYNGTGATYQWYINGYYTTQPSFLNSTGGLIGYKTALPGTYTALLVVTDAAHQKMYQSSQTFTFTRGIVPVPSPSFTVGSVVASGSGTATVLLNSTTPYVQGGVINAWTVTPMTNVAAFNTASSSPTLTITQTSAAQTFNASLTVTPTNGCKSYTTAVQAINVPAYSPIVPSFTVGVTKSKVDACNDSVFIVNNTTGGVGGNTYTWYFGDSSAAYVTTSTATIGRIYIYPTTYNILLVVTDKSGQTASKTAAVTTVGTIPAVTANAIIYGPYYTPTASTVTLDGGNSSTTYGSLTYLWTLTPTGGSETTYTAANVPLTINRTRVNQGYTAVLTVKDALTGCRASTATQTFTVNELPAGTNYAVTSAEMTEETKNMVSVYPNPARSMVNVKIMLANASDNVEIKVFNTMGMVIIDNHQSTGNSKELTTNMSVANLAAGLYYIKVYNETGALIGSSTIVKQ